ncbi:MAG: alanine--tRNA ligase [bacterium]|nr:alanine--tRNA ligase [bacterium]
MTGNEIRKKFLEYFGNKDHLICPSASLVPDDPSVLFSIAGMVQFKKNFLGEERLSKPRAVSSQKCLRTNDLENVGKTARHHTFFEMLGNFSFGDYFKEEAIQWGWEFITKEMGISSKDLWVSIYKEDDDALKIWKKHLPESRIVRLGEDSNFWTMGPTGPCGPCSEIIIDLGDKRGCNGPDCRVGCNCDRYLELWNLVFTQFNRDENGKLHPLPQKNIDTGMGLERLASVIQNTPTNFETDLIKPIIDNIKGLANLEDQTDLKQSISFKIIADHIRAITFLISDGVHPGNEGRGYVLRRLIRRAVRHGRLLGIDKKFLYITSGEVVHLMKDAYPELHSRRDYIAQLIVSEEDRFRETLRQGMNLLEDIIRDLKKNGKKLMLGSEVFKLYDTFGFPLDLTQEILAEENLSLDEKEFCALLEEQKKQARKFWKGSGDEELNPLWAKLNTLFSETEFTGYEKEKSESEIVGIVKNNELADNAEQGEEAEFILNLSPFYGESGGQVGDKGIFFSEGKRVEISDTKKIGKGIFLHKGKVVKGNISRHDQISAVIDIKNRLNIARNHSSTHLLQSSLRKILGNHVEQSGSLVGPDSFRFDYSHFSHLSPDETERIEDLVNEKIRENLHVQTKETSLKEAVKMGATALFGEKYTDRVRVVKIEDFSLELCGGTHVKRTGDIGAFKIISDQGISSGIRRIEAVTGYSVIKLLREKEAMLQELAEKFKSNQGELLPRADKFIHEYKNMEKELARQKENVMKDKMRDLVNDYEDIGGIKIVVKKVEEMDMDVLRKSVDNIKMKLNSGIIVLGSIMDGKPLICVGVTKDLTKKYQADRILKDLTRYIDGGGGGRVDFAVGGGKKVEGLDNALKEAREIIRKL